MTPKNKTIAALYISPRSIYKTMSDVDPWDPERDATKWPGGTPAVLHPPCGQWARLRAQAHHNPEEKALGLIAVEQVKQWGGVLEHPNASTLWKTAGLPPPNSYDDQGGFTIQVDQLHWGHKARKSTWLYIFGTERKNIPSPPILLSYPETTIGQMSRTGRAATPPEFARWLVDIAKTCAA